MSLFFWKIQCLRAYLWMCWLLSRIGSNYLVVWAHFQSYFYYLTSFCHSYLGLIFWYCKILFKTAFQALVHFWTICSVLFFKLGFFHLFLNLAASHLYPILASILSQNIFLLQVAYSFFQLLGHQLHSYPSYSCLFSWEIHPHLLLFTQFVSWTEKAITALEQWNPCQFLCSGTSFYFNMLFRPSYVCSNSLGSTIWYLALSYQYSVGDSLASQSHQRHRAPPDLCCPRKCRHRSLCYTCGHLSPR